MRIFSRSTLVSFWARHADAETPLRLWLAIVQSAAWTGPADVCAAFGSADFLANNRVIFDIKGNKYRRVAQLKYGSLYLIYIRFVGTHREYDRIDAATI